MPKNKKFIIIDGEETKEVEALSFKKAVKSYQGSTKSKIITVEWEAKKGGVELVGVLHHLDRRDPIRVLVHLQLGLGLGRS